MKVLKIAVLLSIMVALLSGYSRIHGQATPVVWSKQFGTPADDDADAIVTDSHNNVVVVGGTSGNLGGTNIGSDDVFINKYDTNGAALWSRQIGSTNEDVASSSCVDSTGNIYVGGTTSGGLFTPLNGTRDAFIVKYDNSGNQVWSKQLGSNSQDCGIVGVAVDNQNSVYAVGFTSGNLYAPNADTSDPTSYDVFLVKYTANGNLQWSKQFGSIGQDMPAGISLDGQGNTYIVGSTEQLYAASSGDDDAFIAKYNSSGTLVWGKQFGTANKDSATSVAVDSNGNDYVTGYNCINSYDNLDTASAFVSKFDTNGNQIWNATPSSGGGDITTKAIIDTFGNVVVSGSTGGSLFAPNSGGKDIFLIKYNPAGTILWNVQFGTSADDEANDVCTDNQGNIYVAGYTLGSLFATNAGGDDIFIQKLSPTGQMASAKPTRPAPYKPLMFAWAGKNIILRYPPVLINKQPYLCAGYLCSGIPGAKVRHTSSHQVVIEGLSKQVCITPGTRTYQINGKPHIMSAKPVMVSNQCYVPLDVMKAVLPYPVHYEAEAQTVHFDPPQRKVARNYSK